MQALPEDLRRRCAADEDLHSPADAIRMATDPQPYGIYNIKLMKCGGIRPAMQIAHVAEQSHIQLMWGCNDESIVSITAALHAALASPATHYLDLDGSFDLARDVVDGGFELRDGYLYPGDGPGLGVRLLEKV
jgi:L-alanine-DL-glutamate epimerase-like enolase superfamily enzyme